MGYRRFFIAGILQLQASTCPIMQGGYLGNQGVNSGNCQPLSLPPLAAFGSLSVNQNAPLSSLNRLNPEQLPVTNNFQNFQHPCAVNQNLWVDGGPGLVGPINPVRTGPFIGYACRTGPAFIIPAYNFNTDNLINAAPPVYGNGLFLPNLTTVPSINLFLSATETNQGGAGDYFTVSTDVVNSATCVVTYTPNNGTQGFIKDYHVTGNLFHDIYYENLTPAIASEQSIVDVAGNIPISIDGGAVQYLSLGSLVTGKSFQLFFPRGLTGPAPYPPATSIIFVENSAATAVQFRLLGISGNKFILTATQPFTGFIRLAAISSQDPLPLVGATWQQGTFYNPENTGDASDCSNPPNSCAIEDPLCMYRPYSCMWWRTTLVQAITPTAMSYYLLTPNQPSGWSTLFHQYTLKLLGPNWSPPTGGCFNTPYTPPPPGDPYHPDPSGITVMMPILALKDYNLANQYYNDYYNHFNPVPGVNNQTYADGIVTSNYFLLQFNMMMASFLSNDSSNFQSGQRRLPDYLLSAPVQTYEIYAAHRRYIPIRADISTSNNSITWSYTLSSIVTPGDGSNKTLVCFPFWKYLQGLTAGVVNTVPGGGEPLQNFIYNDVTKGTLYAAEAINGNVTFLEGGLPSWYGPDLFIPSTLTFTAPQITVLNNILNNIFPNLIDPLPLFPEVYLNTAYTGLRTIFMLANTGLVTGYFLNASGQQGSIMTKSKPFIDNAKSVLTTYLINRTPGSSFFIADRTTGGICVNGGGGIGDYPEGPNLQQINDSGADFGNYVYNDHHFFAGYALLAAAMITEWELKYGSGPLWVQLPVLGADNQQYQISDFIDFLWRDVHNPFKDDPDLPYDRYGLPWEGHSVANGMQYDPNTNGRNQESIAEDFNCWYGINAFAQAMLKTSLTAEQTAKYAAVRDFSEMNMKMTGSSAVMWFKNPTYWKVVTDYTTLTPSICVGQFSQVTVTNGQVNDNSLQNQVFQ